MSTVTSADGTTIDYESFGEEGPTVVFIGGATQHRAIDPVTTATARAVAQAGFRTVDYDRRGRGNSTDTKPWSLDREVEDLAALIEAVGAPAALYTSSSGATIALAAVAAGLPVERLALYEPPFFAGASMAEHLTRLRELLAEGRNDEAMRYNLGSVINVPAPMIEGMAASPAWPAFLSVAPTLVYDLSGCDEINTDPDWKARWAKVTVPTVVLSGDQTFPGMPEAADNVAAALPNATRRVLAGQSHGPETSAIAPVIVEILRG